MVSEHFLETYGLSVGDRITVQLGDKLTPQNSMAGAMALGAGKRLADFVSTKELEIAGAYRMTDDVQTRIAESEWAYTENTVFVPASLLPVAVPDDYEGSAGEFSVFVEKAQDIEAFKGAAEPLAAEMGLGLRFSDGGWMRVKDSFENGERTSLFTVVFYVFGAMLAQFLAVYLYVGGEKKSYAIMRTLGVPARKAATAIVLPFGVLLAVAIPASSAVGILYTSRTAAAALSGLSEGMPEDYVLNAALSLKVIVVCLLAEAAYVIGISFAVLGKMRKIPPLELLQVGSQTGATKRETSVRREETPPPADFAVSKLLEADEAPVSGGYSAFCQVTTYAFRQIRRNIGKTLLSLLLAVVLFAGTGVFILAMHTYQDAFYETDVTVRVTGFSSDSIKVLSESDLAKGLYYYGKLSVRAGSAGTRNQMTLTNDLERYLEGAHRITYADGYDASVFESDEAVCLLGQTAAAMLNVQAGDEISFLTDDLYSFLQQLYEEESAFTEAVARAGMPYRVAGIVESADEDVNTGIFTSANRAAETLYGQPFPIGYCECILTDNGRIHELNVLLDEQKNQQLQYAPTASFYVDTVALENIRRIRDLLQSLFPVVVAATVLLALIGSALVITQSATEAACMRILGTGRKRARCMLVSGHLALCLIGMIFVAGLLLLGAPALFAGSVRTFAVCWTLYLASFVCGAFLAAVQLTGQRILELLQRKE